LRLIHRYHLLNRKKKDFEGEQGKSNTKNKLGIMLVLIPGVASDPRCLNFGLVLSCAAAISLESDSSCKHHFDKAKCAFGSETCTWNYHSTGFEKRQIEHENCHSSSELLIKIVNSNRRVGYLTIAILQKIPLAA
jgi:hypothetical protein